MTESFALSCGGGVGWWAMVTKRENYTHSKMVWGFQERVDSAATVKSSGLSHKQNGLQSVTFVSPFPRNTVGSFYTPGTDIPRVQFAVLFFFSQLECQDEI